MSLSNVGASAGSNRQPLIKAAERLSPEARLGKEIANHLEDAIKNGDGLMAMDYNTWKMLELARDLQRADLDRGELRAIASKMKALGADMVDPRGSNVVLDAMEKSMILEFKQASLANRADTTPGRPVGTGPLGHDHVKFSPQLQEMRNLNIKYD